MWRVLISGGVMVLAVVFSLAKVSSHSVKMAETHRTELLARKKQESAQYNSHNKKTYESLK